MLAVMLAEALMWAVMLAEGEHELLVHGHGSAESFYPLVCIQLLQSAHPPYFLFVLTELH